MKPGRKVNHYYLLIGLLLSMVLYGLTFAGQSFKSLPFERSASPHDLNNTQRLTRASLPKQFFRHNAANTLFSIHTDTLPLERSDTSKAASKTSLAAKDSALLPVVDTFDLRISKDSLDAPIAIDAEDSMVVDVPNNKIYIYRRAKVKYKDVSLAADIIEVDQQSQLLTAYAGKDSAGNRSGVPSFEQGPSSFTFDTIRYNLKTQKGLTVGTYTQEGEMFIYGEKVKRIDPKVFFVDRARFTSCNYDTPHFAFRTRKVKFISEQLAITGFTRPEFEGIPIPIGLPWGLFPLKQGRRTGLLPPQFTANEQLGVGLEGLGYYKAINDYWDVTFRGNIYSYGTWNLFITPNYRKRYRYSGGFNLSIMNNQVAFKGDPDYQKSRNYSFQWSHTVDGKARPGTSFSASVNVATSSFNRFVTNNAFQNFNNQLNSSISYQRRWEGTPFNLSVNANHNQNTNQRIINLNLPDIGFTMNTIYPFQKKEFVGQPKWYEKLGVGINSNIRTQMSFYDTAANVIRQLIDTFQWGAQHAIPIQLSLPPMGPLQIGPAISLEERWYSRQFIRQWNPVTRKVDTVINKGFFTARQMSFGLNFSTALFGTMNFKGNGVKAIRHVIRPTIGLSYKPDLTGDQWYTVQTDTLGNRFQFSKYDNSIFGGFAPGRAGFVSITLDNNLEMKVKNKKDTAADAVKKVKLIDGFGFTTGYNLLADSFPLSDFQLYLRSNLFDKINFTAGASLSPYEENQFGRRLQQYVWSNGKLPRFINGFISVNTSLKSKPLDENKEKQKREIQRNLPYDEMGRELAMTQQNPMEFTDFNIPWSVDISYALNLSRQLRPDYSGYQTFLTQSLNLRGDFNLTEKWKVQAQTTYDFQSGKLQFFTASVAREMHCWQMAINVTPVGYFRSFSISINPKSSLLRDLRINRTRFFYNFAQ